MCYSYVIILDVQHDALELERLVVSITNGNPL